MRANSDADKEGPQHSHHTLNNLGMWQQAARGQWLLFPNSPRTCESQPGTGYHCWQLRSLAGRRAAGAGAMAQTSRRHSPQAPPPPRVQGPVQLPPPQAQVQGRVRGRARQAARNPSGRLIAAPAGHRRRCCRRRPSDLRPCPWHPWHRVQALPRGRGRPLRRHPDGRAGAPGQTPPAWAPMPMLPQQQLVAPSPPAPSPAAAWPRSPPLSGAGAPPAPGSCADAPPPRRVVSPQPRAPAAPQSPPRAPPLAARQRRHKRGHARPVSTHGSSVRSTCACSNTHRAASIDAGK